MAIFSKLRVFFFKVEDASKFVLQNKRDIGPRNVNVNPEPVTAFFVKNLEVSTCSYLYAQLTSVI